MHGQNHIKLSTRFLQGNVLEVTGNSAVAGITHIVF